MRPIVAIRSKVSDRLCAIWVKWCLPVFLVGCTHVFYQPTREVHLAPDKLPTPPREMVVPVGEDQIAVWYFESKTKYSQGSVRPLVIQFHGNGENMTSHFISLYWLLEHGVDLLAFDYRGYGKSTGEATPENTVQDGIAMLRWAVTQFPRRTLVVHGQSLGGAVALKALQALNGEVPVCGVVAESTFSSYRSVAASALASSWITWLFQPLAYVLVSDRVAPQSGMKSMKPVPFLIVHQQDDPIVPFKHGEKLAELAPAPKDFWPVPGKGHASTFWGPTRHEYRTKYLNWINEHCFAAKASTL